MKATEAGGGLEKAAVSKVRAHPVVGYVVVVAKQLLGVSAVLEGAVAKVYAEGAVAVVQVEAVGAKAGAERDATTGM